MVLLGICLEPKARILFLRMSDAELSQGQADSIRVLHSATQPSIFWALGHPCAKQQHNTHSDVIIVIYNLYNLLIFSASLLSLGGSRSGQVLLKHSLKVNMLVSQSCPTLCAPWTVAHQAPLSMGFSRQEYWSGLPCPSPDDLPNPGIEPGSPALQADLLSEPPGKPNLKAPA